jgi:methylglutaconyl-CoA hydratase
VSPNILTAINEQHVATITLNRPEVHNAFDDSLIQDLLTSLKNLQADPLIKVVILAAAGKNFSAGADLNWMRRMANYRYEENLQDALGLAELMHTLKFLTKPVIAKVQGAVYGGGVGLVACCDMAVGAIDVTFCLSEVKIGLIPAVISPYLVTAIGERAARRYCLTAEQIPAREALQLGLLTEVVAKEELDDTVEALVQKLLKNSPAAVSAAKVLMNRVSINPYDERHTLKNAESIAEIRVSAEGQEGLSAFLEKRPPVWGKG